MKKFKLCNVLAVSALIAFSTSSHAESFFIQAPAMPLAAAGGEANAVVVAKKTIGSGTWYISAKANPVNRVIDGTVATGSQDIARCGLYVNSLKVDLSSTHLGDGPTVGGGLPAVATITNQARITVPVDKRRQIYFKCWHDYDVDGQYLDASASLYIATAP